RVGGKTAFLMGFETDRAAVYQIRPQHRNEEVREIIPSDYAGVMITDRGKSYDAGEFDAVEQQKCLGHILRNITEVLETKQGRAREFGVYAKLLLQDGMELWRARDSKPSKRSWRDIAASSRSPKDGWPMGTKRYRTLYAMLLWLYPRPFRERFAEGTAQTFHDLCQEHQGATRSLFGFALWVFCETLFGIIRENTMQMSQLGRTILRVALGALAVWMVPLVASQFVEDWHWRVGGFVRVYVVLFLTGIVMALVASRMGVWSHKAGVGLALAAGLALGWSTMVQVADSESPANLVYYGVLVMGAIGASLSRLKPRALANTLFAMAATLTLIAILLPSGAPPDMARRMAIGHGVFAAMFAASGFLFRHASVAKVN
ncbi:MAG: transposase, partial [Acidobacteria bacterium]|nr:transposase [Acidobacteriota bacterium]